MYTANNFPQYFLETFRIVEVLSQIYLQGDKKSMPEMWQARFIDISVPEAKWMDNMTYDTKGPDARTGAILLKMSHDFVGCLLFLLFVFFSASICLILSQEKWIPTSLVDSPGHFNFPCQPEQEFSPPETR